MKRSSPISLLDLSPKVRQQATRQILAQTKKLDADEPPKPSKYRNMKRLYISRQGFEILAASIKEARGYADLDTLIGAGHVVRWVPQVSFLLQGGSRYVADAL